MKLSRPLIPLNPHSEVGHLLKFLRIQNSASHRSVRPKGFALIVTLSLMILLTVIAVGLLTLSSISLRSTSQGKAMATARANARMALMLAIGELQKAAGPDKAITAQSEIDSASPAKPHLTGVWDSWDFNVKSSSPDYDGVKNSPSQGNANPGFRGWLISDPDFNKTTERNYPGTQNCSAWSLLPKTGLKFFKQMLVLLECF